MLSALGVVLQMLNFTNRRSECQAPLSGWRHPTAKWPITNSIGIFHPAANSEERIRQKTGFVNEALGEAGRRRCLPAREGTASSLIVRICLETVEPMRWSWYQRQGSMCCSCPSKFRPPARILRIRRFEKLGEQVGTQLLHSFTFRERV
jgi:hypothetical protein